MHHIMVIPGDGIGPEVIDSAVEVLGALEVDIEFSHDNVGYDVFKEQGTSITDDTLATARDSDAVLFGATTTPFGVKDYNSAILTLRRELGLYANLRPAKQGEIDMLVVRENSEGLYSGLESIEGDEARAIRVITRGASERIGKFAFELARAEKRKSVMVVHKANVLRITDGLFRDTVREVASHYPEIELTDGIVDAIAMKLVADPGSFDVIVTTNLFGDILSDIASQVTGGIGLAASANIGDSHALFEPVHGSAPDIAGKGIANPIAAAKCAQMMLAHLGEEVAAHRLKTAVEAVMAGPIQPPDQGGGATTKQVTAALIAALPPPG